MQNISNMSYFYLQNPMNYITYIPITPTPSEISTPVSQHSLGSTATIIFPTTLDNFYYGSQCFPWAQEPQCLSLNKIETSNISQTHPLSANLETESRKTLKNPSAFQISNIKEEGSLKAEQQSVGYVLKNEQQKPMRKSKKPILQFDHDYMPSTQKCRKSPTRYQVNQNRNVIPNEINQIFSFVQKPNKSSYIVTKLFEKYPHPKEFTTKKFYLYQALLKDKLGHYTNQKSLKLVTELYEPKCENWTEQEQRYYNKICRVLIHHFLYEDSIFIILTSKRMKREKKCAHLSARRQIAQSVGNILKGF